MKQNKKAAFTLVELIVVITILAILGTIAFISLQGYSAQSRDSTRISDLSTMRTSLELFQLDAGKYPLPTDGVDITYSGGVVWNQGIFGESAFKNVEKLDKIPTDPLTNSKYTYSVTATRNEYEIAGITETDLAINILDNTFAGEVEATAIVTGTYNGKMTKTLSGTTCDILSIPTIIASDIEASTDIVEITNNERFVYDGYNNLPHSYKSSKYDILGGFSFTPNKLVAYTDTGSCTALTSKSSYTARVELLQGLQDSYSGTTLKNVGEIKRIVNLVIDVNEPSTEVQNYAGSFVNNTLGGNVEIINTVLVSNGGGAGEYSIYDCPVVNSAQNGDSIIKSDILTNINDYIGCSIVGEVGKISGYTYSGSVLEINKMVILSESINETGTFQWGPFDDTPALNNSSSSYLGIIEEWDGYSNTQIIVARLGVLVETNKAAQICDSKGEGWYLPSIQELTQLYCYSNQASVGDFHYSNTCTSKGYISANIGTLLNYGISPSNYWSSTETNNTDIWTTQFTDGMLFFGSYKDGYYNVRCINRF